MAFNQNSFTLKDERNMQFTEGGDTISKVIVLAFMVCSAIGGSSGSGKS